MTAIIVLGAMIFIFFLIRIIPGDPVRTILGTRATPELVADLHSRMGLDQPIHIQLLKFLGDTFHGDLGTDIWSHRPVSRIILEALPYTVALATSSLLLAAIIGIPLGCYSAAHRNSIIDRITTIMSISLITTPTFVVSLFLLLIFAVHLRWFPVIGGGEMGDFLDQLWHLVLPSLSLALAYIGYFARLIRSSILEILTEDYIRTARASGVAEQAIIYKHALKNALLPFVAIFGVEFGLFLGGEVFVEIIFCRPGIGTLIYDAILTRNYPVVQGGIIVTVFLYAIVNMLADMSYGLVDPRIRLE
jgi:peptide/nickel transport system permease protein